MFDAIKTTLIVSRRLAPFLCDSRLALTAMNKYPEAISYFKKALVLDPENDTYKSNLKIAEQKQKEATSPVSKNSPNLPVNHYFVRGTHTV